MEVVAAAAAAAVVVVVVLGVEVGKGRWRKMKISGRSAVIQYGVDGEEEEEGRGVRA